MALFNMGLSSAFTPLGSKAGSLLPAAYLRLDSESSSPYFSYAGGLTLVVAVVFTIGFLATRAEPGLRVLGQTVQQLTNGSFHGTFLVYSVCVGVGIGMAAGTMKILFSVSIIYFLIGKYTVAFALTALTNDVFSSIAWDSAGGFAFFLPFISF